MGLSPNKLSLGLESLLGFLILSFSCRTIQFGITLHLECCKMLVELLTKGREKVFHIICNDENIGFHKIFMIIQFYEISILISKILDSRVIDQSAGVRWSCTNVSSQLITLGGHSYYIKLSISLIT